VGGVQRLLQLFLVTFSRAAAKRCFASQGFQSNNSCLLRHEQRTSRSRSGMSMSAKARLRLSAPPLIAGRSKVEGQQPSHKPTCPPSGCHRQGGRSCTCARCGKRFRQACNVRIVQNPLGFARKTGSRPFQRE